MTIDHRFEQQLPERLADLATAPYPEYLEDVLAVTARTPRRPAWRFPGRWLPAGIVMPRLLVGPIPVRPVLVLLALLLLVIGAALVYVGSRPRLPDPFGIARNGVVAFSAEGDVYAADGGNGTRLLLAGPGDEVGVSFSPDGTRIAFVRLIDGEEYLMAADADGSHVIPLLAEPVVNLSYAWAPDGRTMAVGHAVEGGPGISIVRTDGSGFETLPLGIAATDPEWRPPDGRELVFRGERNGTADLFVVQPDGSGPRALGLRSHGLLGGAYDVLGAAWSPDGSRIAYHTVDPVPGALDGRRFQVHVVNADGTNDRVVSVSPVHVEEAWPEWSPDGTQLAIQRWHWHGDGVLAVIPADGRGPGIEVGKRTPFEANMGWNVTWSPDGTRILAFWDEAAGVVSVDARTGEYETPPWTTTDLPAWQRLAP